MKKSPFKHGVSIKTDGKVIDMVCGMELSPSQTTLRVEHREELYYFCSKTCYDHFINDPEMYVG